MTTPPQLNDIAQLQAGQRLRPREFAVTRSDVVRYAGASGDFNPLHYDDAAAQTAGLAGAFAHGMFSAGCLATALTDEVGVDSLTRFAVRFRAQARLGVTLRSDLIVREVTRQDRGVLVELDCNLADENGAVVVSGSASAATPSCPVPSEADSAPPLDAGELVGGRLAPAVVTVERGPAQVFVAAVKDDNPVYRSAPAAAAAGLEGIPIAPTYLFAVANFGAFAEDQPPPPPGSATLVELIAALRGGRKGAVLHGEQSFTYFAPVRVGDVLHVDGYVESLEDKAASGGRPAMTVMVVRTDYRDERARLLTTARSSYLFRHAAR
jgi:acyl dehydratase